MTKESFLEIISKSTPEEINRIIMNKGQKPKVYCPVTIFNQEVNNNEPVSKSSRNNK